MGPRDDEPPRGPGGTWEPTPRREHLAPNPGTRMGPKESLEILQVHCVADAANV